MWVTGVKQDKQPFQRWSSPLASSSLWWWSDRVQHSQVSAWMRVAGLVSPSGQTSKAKGIKWGSKHPLKPTFLFGHKPVRTERIDWYINSTCGLDGDEWASSLALHHWYKLNTTSHPATLMLILRLTPAVHWQHASGERVKLCVKKTQTPLLIVQILTPYFDFQPYQGHVSCGKCAKST